VNGNILVLCEHNEVDVDNITLELVCRGRAMADAWGTQLAVLVIGSKIEPVVESLKTSGVDMVLAAQDFVLKDYSAELYTTVTAEAVKAFNPAVVLMGYTYLGMEVGPAVAVRLGGTMVANCTELDIMDGKLVVARNMFGATLQARVELTGAAPYLISIEKGLLPREIIASKDAAVNAVAFDAAGQKLRSRIIEIFSAATGDVDITKAKILVSIGRGIGGPEKIQPFRDLAAALGGEISCSRPVADMGWLPVAHQVGISASTVSPDVYIACGISGASQHVTAMRDSGTIIAINKDPNAPIFRVANYGIVGDVLEVVPAMIAEAAKQ
jgi:electron transfer flavoprotein alpha subunit